MTRLYSMKKRRTPFHVFDNRIPKLSRPDGYGMHVSIPVEIEELVFSYLTKYSEYSELRTVCKRWNYVITKNNLVVLDLGLSQDWQRFIKLVGGMLNASVPLRIYSDAIKIHHTGHTYGTSVQASYPTRLTFGTLEQEGSYHHLPRGTVLSLLRTRYRDCTLSLRLWKGESRVLLVRTSQKSKTTKTILWKPMLTPYALDELTPLGTPTFVSDTVSVADILMWTKNVTLRPTLVILEGDGIQKSPLFLSLMKADWVIRVPLYPGDGRERSEPKSETLVILGQEYFNTWSIRNICGGMDPAQQIALCIHLDGKLLELSLKGLAYSLSFTFFALRG